MCDAADFDTAYDLLLDYLRAIRRSGDSIVLAAGEHPAKQTAGTMRYRKGHSFLPIRGGP